MILRLVFAMLLALAGAQAPAASGPTRHIRFETREGTWLSPALSPDGRTIIFELLGDLYSLPAGGGRATRLTAGLAFDSQPAFSPDGGSIAFVSDRSGAENLWVARRDGSGPRQLTFRTDNAVLTSPSWSADGRSLYVSSFRPELAAFELLQVDREGGEPRVLIPALAAGGVVTSVLGARPSRDGRYLYYAARVDGEATPETPTWTVRRRVLATGRDGTVVAPSRSYRPDLILGTYFRPVPSPDGTLLAFATRRGADTWLKLRDLRDGRDRWLVKLTDRDELNGGAPWRDLLQSYSFTPDGTALLVGDRGGIQRIAVADGRVTPVKFVAAVDAEAGPATRVTIREEDGPVRARVIQAPEQSPDGSRLAFSALGRVFVMPLTPDARPALLSASGYQPSWSPDGRRIAFVTWDPAEGGQVMVADVATGAARAISRIGAFYSAPTFAPDGRHVVAIRSRTGARNDRYMEYGPLREAELVAIPVGGGEARVVAAGSMGGKPHFAADGRRLFVLMTGGLGAVDIAGGDPRLVREVTGPGFYFDRGRAPVDNARLSPDGRWLLVQIAQQLTLLGLPDDAAGAVDIASPTVLHRRLTDVGADYFGWADGGRTITWAVGSTFYRLPLAAVTLDAAGARRLPPIGTAPAQAFEIAVTTPRDRPAGSVLLRGATALTMRGDEAIADADILVTDGRIAAIGPRGRVAVPAGTPVRDLAGRWVAPGYIDAHDHRADIRREVLDRSMWSAAASLAFGVTTLFDPSSLSIDLLVYQDMVDAGLVIGSRLRTTGPALFSFNEFRTRAEVGHVLDRYRDHYRLGNVKLYRTGNRQVRQWIIDAARERGLMVTTEGAGADKLGLSMILDGAAGHEHSLAAVPLYEDVVRLLAESGTSYVGTLTIQGRPSGQDWFVTRANDRADARLRRFTPPAIMDMKFRHRDWHVADAYRFPGFAAGLAAVARAGGVVGIGSHGEVPGLGYHWELRAHAAGGMTPSEVLRAATMGSATTIGRHADLGSLQPGKLADLVVLSADPRLDVANLAKVEQVMKEGRLHDAATLDELFPRARRFPPQWHSEPALASVSLPGASPAGSGRGVRVGPCAADPTCGQVASDADRGRPSDQAR